MCVQGGWQNTRLPLGERAVVPEKKTELYIAKILGRRLTSCPKGAKQSKEVERHTKTTRKTLKRPGKVCLVQESSLHLLSSRNRLATGRWLFLGRSDGQFTGLVLFNKLDDLTLVKAPKSKFSGMD